MNESHTPARTKRERLNGRINHLRDRVAETGDAGRQALEDNPGIAVAIAATVGAVVAAAVPTSRREVQALRPVARKAKRSLDMLVENTKSAGIQQLADMGVTSAAISSGITGLVGAILSAGKANAPNRTVANAAPSPNAPTEPS